MVLNGCGEARGHRGREEEWWEGNRWQRSAGEIEGGVVDNIGVRPKRAEFGETHETTLSYFGVL